MAVGGVGSTPGEAAGGAPGAGAGLGNELVATPGGIEAPQVTPTLRLGPGRHQRTLGRDNCHDAVLGQEAQCGGAVQTPGRPRMPPGCRTAGTRRSASGAAWGCRSGSRRAADRGKTAETERTAGASRRFCSLDGAAKLRPRVRCELPRPCGRGQSRTPPGHPRRATGGRHPRCWSGGQRRRHRPRGR